MESDKASVTELAQDLAWFLRSNFFLIFLIGVLLDLDDGIEVWERPGCSPSFQCLIFFLPTAGEEEGAYAQMIVVVVVLMRLLAELNCDWEIREGKIEEENDRDKEEDVIPSRLQLRPNSKSWRSRSGVVDDGLRRADPKMDNSEYESTLSLSIPYIKTWKIAFTADCFKLFRLFYFILLFGINRTRVVWMSITQEPRKGSSPECPLLESYKKKIQIYDLDEDHISNLLLNQLLE